MPIFKKYGAGAPLQRNLYLLYAVSFFQGLVFYSPIATLYRQARGLTLAQLAVTESVFAVCSLAMELPWGLLADRIGYRRTMVICNTLYFFSKVIFWRADCFGLFLLERLVFAVAVAGLSGVDSSVLYLSCPKGQSQRAFGIYGACGTAGMVFATLFYTLCIGENYDLAASATVMSHGLALLCTLGLAEVRPAEGQPRQTVLGFLSLLGQTARQWHFMLASAGCALYSETAHMVTTFLNQPQYVRCGLSVQRIGWAFLAANAVAMAGAASYRLTQRAGARRLAGAVFALSAAACALLACTRSAFVSVGAILLLSAASSVLTPLLSELKNQQVFAADRATQLSIYSIFSDLTMAGADLALCTAADRSLPGAFWLAAAVCLLGGAPLMLWLRKRRLDA